MHDIDRTLAELETEGEYESEFESEAGEFEFEGDDTYGELEFEGDDDMEAVSLDAPAQIFGMELEGLSPEDQEFEACKRFVRLTSDAVANALAGSKTSASPAQVVRASLIKAARKHAPGLVRGESESEFEFEGLAPGDSGRVFSDAEEMELAGDLLNVSNDAELEQFLGKLFHRVTKGVGRFFKRGIGGTLFRAIKGLAKTVLPAVGGIFGGPVGGLVGSALGKVLGGGRRRRRGRGRRRIGGRRRSGRWIRRGSSIVLIGA